MNWSEVVLIVVLYDIIKLIIEGLMEAKDDSD